MNIGYDLFSSNKQIGYGLLFVELGARRVTPSALKPSRADNSAAAHSAGTCSLYLRATSGSQAPVFCEKSRSGRWSHCCVNVAGPVR